MAGFCQMTNGNHHVNGEEVMVMDFDETKSEIMLLSGFSNRLENILLALLKDHNALKDRVEKDRASILSTIGQVHNELVAENSERKKDLALIQKDMKNQEE